MVAKITLPKSIDAALNYNEKKVQKGQAICLTAVNYLRDARDMNFYQKLDGFERLNLLNERATTKALHVSLNFDPTEKISDEKLVTIATDYMDKIGFGEQPFLVYKHEDAGHPHIHIVSNTIRSDGSRINTHNIGRNQSEKARKEIEDFYSLVKAERQQKSIAIIQPIDIAKAVYGKAETKRSISNIVGLVFNQYRFASLPEYNAALRQFNVIADRGKEEGRIYKNHGLVYRLLDAEGDKIGVPIKASSIYCQPTLAKLEGKFIGNAAAKNGLEKVIKNAVDIALLSAVDMSGLITALRQQNIYVLLRQNEAGRLYGITFVDNQIKVVFNGSDLGKGYSVVALINRFENRAATVLNSTSSAVEKEGKTNDLEKINLTSVLGKNQEHTIADKNILEILFDPEKQSGFTPSQLLQKKRKKKKKHTDY